jgi:type IV pilus assembly protein PilV
MRRYKESDASVGRQAGVVLLEVLAAILIFSIGILSVISLQAAAVANVSDAKYRLDASAIADRVIGQMWANQAGMGSYVGTSAVDELPDGSMTVALASASDVTVTITWQPPGGTSHTFSTVARIYPN